MKVSPFKKVIRSLHEKSRRFLDYVIVNDCSTDDTEALLQSSGFNYISFSSNLGIGGAVQAGYKYAKQMHYDIAVQMDGDGQHDPLYF